MPSRTSVVPRSASSAATATSQTATSPAPPPSAAPWMRPTTGFGQRVDPAEHRREGRGVAPVLLGPVRDHPLHPGEVGAGAEGPSLPREDDRPGRAVCGERLERLRQPRDQDVVEGVPQRRAGRGRRARRRAAAARPGAVAVTSSPRSSPSPSSGIFTSPVPELEDELPRSGGPRAFRRTPPPSPRPRSPRRSRR